MCCHRLGLVTACTLLASALGRVLLALRDAIGRDANIPCRLRLLLLGLQSRRLLQPLGIYAASGGNERGQREGESKREGGSIEHAGSQSEHMHGAEMAGSRDGGVQRRQGAEMAAQGAQQEQ